MEWSESSLLAGGVIMTIIAVEIVGLAIIIEILTKDW
jgi:hypothetical protein